MSRPITPTNADRGNNWLTYRQNICIQIKIDMQYEVIARQNITTESVFNLMDVYLFKGHCYVLFILNKVIIILLLLLLSLLLLLLPLLLSILLLLFITIIITKNLTGNLGKDYQKY